MLGYMEKKFRRKIFLKRVSAFLCVIAVLQSYISSFAYVVKAVDSIVIGEDEEPQNEAVMIGEDEENNSNDVDKPKSEEQTNNVIQENSVEKSENTVENLEGTENSTSTEENSKMLVGDENNSGEVQGASSGDEKTESPDEYIEPELALAVTSENSTIYKGYLYANATSAIAYATNYNTITEVTVTGSRNMTRFTVQDEADKIGLITNTKIALLEDMYYKQTRISVEEFNNLLGEDGQITIYADDGVIIGYINSETPVEDRIFCI
jgi:hypothetical protein